LHASIFDAVNDSRRNTSPYSDPRPRTSRGWLHNRLRRTQQRNTSWSHYTRRFQTNARRELTQDLAQIPEGQGKADGVIVGKPVAARFWALTQPPDGANSTLPPFIPGSQPGDYQFINTTSLNTKHNQTINKTVHTTQTTKKPPNFAPADFTHGRNISVRPGTRWTNFRPEPPPQLTSDEYNKESQTKNQSLGFQLPARLAPGANPDWNPSGRQHSGLLGTKSHRPRRWTFQPPRLP